MTPIKDDTVLKIGDVILSHSKYAPSFDSMKHQYVIVDITLGMYVIQDLENVDKKYYFIMHNFVDSLNSSYFLL